MVGGVDQEFRKPRRLRGTPANKYVLMMWLGSATISCLCAYRMSQSRILKYIVDNYYTDEEMHREHTDRELRSKVMHESLGHGQSSADQIRRKLRVTQQQKSEGKL